jgi:hypothetical protein
VRNALPHRIVFDGPKEKVKDTPLAEAESDL